MSKYAEVFRRVMDAVRTYSFNVNLRCTNPGPYEGEPIETLYYDVLEPDETIGPYRVYEATAEEKELFEAKVPLYILYTREDGFINGSWCQEWLVASVKEQSSEFDM